MSDWIKNRYENVYSYIDDGIRAGDLVPGARLAGERKLAEMLTMSRETVRQGLDLAEQAGLIVRVPQRGTYIASPRVDQDLGTMRSFNQTVRGLAMSPTYRVINEEKVRLDAESAELLRVKENTDAMLIAVMGLANGQPMALYHSTLPQWIVERIGPDVTWGERATYEQAADALSLETLSAHQKFEAVNLRGDLARTLKVRGGMAGFKTTSVFFTPDGSAVEVRRAWYPGSRYRFRTSRQINTK